MAEATRMTVKERARELVSRMTLEEKAGLCSGKDNWTTKPIERLGLEPVTVADGPHGLRKLPDTADALGVGQSLPSACFPTASALACSFDRELAFRVGRAMGEACVQEGVSTILGPGVNQKRSPLCGRNFEYFSEDPVVSGEMAASLIQGIQSTGTGACLKHFAVNNQETRRMSVNAVVDERALRETYLKAFEIAVKKGQPRSLMCAYNRVGGVYCSENAYLLTKILREEWGYEGAVFSDWGAVHDRAQGVMAGLDIQMPGNGGYNDAKVMQAVENGALPQDALDQTARRVTEFILTGLAHKKADARYDAAAHHALAVHAAGQSAVLLKNDGGILPGSAAQKAAVIGAFAKAPRYQGAGSSKITPLTVDSPFDALAARGVDAVYSPGYSLTGSARDAGRLIREACKAAKGKDIIYIFAGLPEGFESEGFDRVSLFMPQEQNDLIEAVSACNPNVAVILTGGSPMALPWLPSVKAVLMAYLGGEGMGMAVADLLLGAACPGGKLAETWPLHAQDVPCARYFPGGRLSVEYRESLYVGYRYYEKAKKEVLFPFGHGLSYARFAYSDLKTDRGAYVYGDKIRLTFRIANLSGFPASETALIFSAHDSSTVFAPEKELRDFVKVHLTANESREISVCLDTASLCYYNTEIAGWHAESGVYRILIGPSSRQCILETSVALAAPDRPQPDLRTKAPSYYRFSRDGFPAEEFAAVLGQRPPIHDDAPARPFTIHNTLDDARHTPFGKIMAFYAKMVARKAARLEKGQEDMILATTLQMPFFAIVNMGRLRENVMNGMLHMINGHYMKGLKVMLKR